MTKPSPPGEQLIVKNRRALYDYEVEERFEAGVVLVGSVLKGLDLDDLLPWIEDPRPPIARPELRR